MRILLAAVLLALPALAAAANPYGYVFSVQPNPVPPGHAIRVTIETTYPPCVPLPPALIPLVRPDGVVILELLTSDGCENTVNESRTYDIGTLPAGDYVFRFAVCGGNPPPGSSGNGCGVLEDVSVRVRGLTGSTFTVPATTGAISAALAALFALLAGWAIRLRRI